MSQSTNDSKDSNTNYAKRVKKALGNLSYPDLDGIEHAAANANAKAEAEVAEAKAKNKGGWSSYIAKVTDVLFNSAIVEPTGLLKSIVENAGIPTASDAISSVSPPVEAAMNFVSAAKEVLGICNLGVVGAMQATFNLVNTAYDGTEHAKNLLDIYQDPHHLREANTTTSNSTIVSQERVDGVGRVFMETLSGVERENFIGYANKIPSDVRQKMLKKLSNNELTTGEIASTFDQHAVGLYQDMQKAFLAFPTDKKRKLLQFFVNDKDQQAALLSVLAALEAKHKSGEEIHGPVESKSAQELLGALSPLNKAKAIIIEAKGVASVISEKVALGELGVNVIAMLTDPVAVGIGVAATVPHAAQLMLAYVRDNVPSLDAFTAAINKSAVSNQVIDFTTAQDTANFIISSATDSHVHGHLTSLIDQIQKIPLDKRMGLVGALGEGKGPTIGQVNEVINAWAPELRDTFNKVIQTIAKNEEKKDPELSQPLKNYGDIVTDVGKNGVLMALLKTSEGQKSLEGIVKTFQANANLSKEANHTSPSSNTSALPKVGQVRN